MNERIKNARQKVEIARINYENSRRNKASSIKQTSLRNLLEQAKSNLNFVESQVFRVN